MMLLKPGSDFAGRYEIVRVLSTGGMGVVYEVLHRDTQRKRALKLMLPSLLADDDMRGRFAREATVTAAIESEHLVEVFDAGVEKESGCPFLVMELLRGEDLGARLNRQELTSPRDVLEMFDQLTRALVRTHDAGIIHRDLKPENIFVTRRDDGTVRMKILDFGIAKLVDRAGKSTRSVGTPIYMAPEQMTGKGVGAPADLYALGQIAFTLLVGAPYFQKEADAAENVLGLMHSVSAGTVEPATARGEALGVHLPSAFDAWFARATHRDPGSRFTSVRQQVDALHAVLDDAPDALPRSSGGKRRAAAFGATEAMVAPARSDAESSEPDAGGSPRPLPEAAPRDVARSAASAHTAVSAPMSQSSAQSSAGPSSRTLGGDSSSATTSRLFPAFVAIGVAAAAVVGLTLTLREGEEPPSPASSSEPRSSVGSAAADPAPVASPARGPIVAPAPPEIVPSPPPSAVTSTSPTSSAKAAPGVRGPIPPAKPSAALAKSSAPPAAPPPPSSTPPPTAGTVWGGPRR